MILNSDKALLYYLTITLASCSAGAIVYGDDTPNSIDEITSPKELTSSTAKDTVFLNTLHSVVLKSATWELAPPLIKLNSDEKLVLHFDDFSDNTKQFRYELVRCNVQWEELSENSMSYISGFTNDFIQDFSFSQNTLQSYIHYQFTFPINYTFTKSGNYVIKVYNRNKEIVLSKKFQVVEPLCKITPFVKKASTIVDADYRQEVDFNITVPSSVSNPLQEIEVHLFKNGNRTDICKGLKPLFIENNTLKYDYDEGNVFDGGNEFRGLNLQSLRSNPLGVRSIEKIDNALHVTLIEEKSRTFGKYFSKDDINGKLLLKNQDREPSEVTSEYLTVHFELEFSQFLPDGDIYIFGELSNWKIDEQFKLHYDTQTKTYKNTLLLKQGFYDYEYVYVKKQNGKIDEAFIEGTHFQTQNEYTIQVYRKNLGLDDYYLIGSHTFMAH